MKMKFTTYLNENGFDNKVIKLKQCKMNEGQTFPRKVKNIISENIDYKNVAIIDNRLVTSVIHNQMRVTSYFNLNYDEITDSILIDSISVNFNEFLIVSDMDILEYLKLSTLVDDDGKEFSLKLQSKFSLNDVNIKEFVHFANKLNLASLNSIETILIRLKLKEENIDFKQLSPYFTEIYFDENTVVKLSTIFSNEMNMMLNNEHMILVTDDLIEVYDYIVDIKNLVKDNNIENLFKFSLIKHKFISDSSNELLSSIITDIKNLSKSGGELNVHGIKFSIKDDKYLVEYENIYEVFDDFKTPIYYLEKLQQMGVFNENKKIQCDLNSLTLLLE